MIGGIDEAGRGPVFGPLVVAGVAADSQEPLRRLGAVDSKKLSPTRRAALDGAIRAVAVVEVRVIDARELNEAMATRTLNEIEVDAFASLLRRLAPMEAFLDACDVDEARFARTVAAKASDAAPPNDRFAAARGPASAGAARAFFPSGACTVRAEHGADARHPIVAAASIIAKVERDRLVAELAREYGAIGSGYSSDPATRAFLDAWVSEHGALPPFARRFWSTARRLVPANRSLSDFGEP